MVEMFSTDDSFRERLPYILAFIADMSTQGGKWVVAPPKILIENSSKIDNQRKKSDRNLNKPARILKSPGILGTYTWESLTECLTIFKNLKRVLKSLYQL